MISGKYTYSILVLLLFSVFSCKDVIYENDLRNVPVYLSWAELRTSVVKTQKRDLVNPGKLYFKDGYIFINEMMNGIHIVNNTDPLNPEIVSFIEIPGNVDMAIKNNILYADSYVDLVALDISDLNNPQEVARIEDVFPYTVPELKKGNLLMAEIEEHKGVVVDWEIDYSWLKVERKSYPMYRGWGYGRGEYAMYDALTAVSTKAAANTASTSVSGYSSTGVQGASFGIGGSMARFGLDGNYLYTVDREDFHIFDIKADNNPTLVNEMEAGEDVETMFIHDGHMFLGTMEGMLIYNLDNPQKPVQTSSYSHVRSCDPVVVQNHIAYVTLRGGTECGATVSRLDILKLSTDYNTSTLLHSFDMREPYGLGIDDEILFVCDGKDGLLVYNAAELSRIPQNKIAQFDDIKAYDVIPFHDYLFMIGEDGFFQYDYSDLQDIKEISVIPVYK